MKRFLSRPLNILFAGLLAASLVVVLLAILVSCSSDRDPDLTPVIMAGATLTPLGPEDPDSRPTPVINTAIPATPAPTTTSEPVRFELPTAVEPVSAWRPPLYPVPWAPSINDHFYFYRPIAADEVNWPLPNYRYGGIFFGDYVHTGIDISAEYGTPVLASGPGTVISAGWGLFVEDQGSPYGQAVVIRHDFGYRSQPLYTVYAHLSEVDVVAGQWLAVGDELGNVGDTGHTTGPHLHFEVRIGSEQFFSTYNPELWVSPPQGWGVLVGRVMGTNGHPLSTWTVVVISNETGRRWDVSTYGAEAVNSDPYYNENVVLSDLPAGVYTVSIEFEDDFYRTEVQIMPGRVTYFTYRGENGYTGLLPPTPDPLDLITPLP
jgi:murein DD-endopeptidase MepM/ murein hydrolase activator NlpD